MAGLSRLKSSSLFETLVALTILSVITGIAMVTFINVTQSSITGEKVRAEFLLSEVVENFKYERNYLDESFVEKGFTIEKKSENFQGNNNLLVISVTILNENNRVVASYKEIIRANDE